jgi:hypothetical protein
VISGHGKLALIEKDDSLNIMIKRRDDGFELIPLYLAFPGQRLIYALARSPCRTSTKAMEWHGNGIRIITVMDSVLKIYFGFFSFSFHDLVVKSEVEIIKNSRTRNFFLQLIGRPFTFSVFPSFFGLF